MYTNCSFGAWVPIAAGLYSEVVVNRGSTVISMQCPLFRRSFIRGSTSLACTVADDRVNDYQHYALDAVQSCAADSPDMGAQVLH